MWRRTLGFLVLTLTLVGCLDTTQPDPSPHAGIFELRSVNGEPLPWNAGERDGLVYEVIRARIILNYDWSFRDEVVYRVTGPSGSSELYDDHTGRYTVQGELLTFTSGDEVIARLVNGTITIEGMGNTALYVRE